MTKLNPIPSRIPKNILKDPESREFVQALIRAVFLIWSKLGGNSGVPIFDETDTPTTDPGWSTSSTVDMRAPDGYIKMQVDGQEVTVPFWNT